MALTGNLVLYANDPKCEPKFGTVNGDVINLLNGGTEPVPATDINGQPILDGANVITIFNDDGTLQGVMQNQGSYCTIATADGVDKEGISYSAGEVIEVFSDGSIDADKHSDNFVALTPGSYTYPNGKVVTWNAGDIINVDADGDVVCYAPKKSGSAAIVVADPANPTQAEIDAAKAANPNVEHFSFTDANGGEWIWDNNNDGTITLQECPSSPIEVTEECQTYDILRTETNLKTGEVKKQAQLSYPEIIDFGRGSALLTPDTPLWDSDATGGVFCEEVPGSECPHRNHINISAGKAINAGTSGNLSLVYYHSETGGGNLLPFLNDGSWVLGTNGGNPATEFTINEISGEFTATTRLVSGTYTQCFVAFVSANGLAAGSSIGGYRETLQVEVNKYNCCEVA